MTTITNFQTRFAFTNPDGTLTMEASRMFREWFARIGGSNASDLSAIETFLSVLTESPAAITEIRKVTESMPQPIDYSAQIAELKKEIEELRQMVAFTQNPTAIAGDAYDTVF